MASAPATPQSSSRAAPTTKVESTQEAPHGQSVSQIGTGGAGPEEAMMHAGAFNTIDVYMRMQFLALSSFRWDVNQAPGTLLWSVPITPRTSHQFIRHLAAMYNTWVGGFDYNIKVCGTGFHAGALAVVRLPPNIAPNTVTSPADFTAFEYLIIDPKTLEVVTEHIIDQRRMMYHYMSDTGTESIGGHIAVYVLVQLNTSSTGSQSIAVQVLTRPSANFNFFQIKPIESSGPTPEPEEPRAIADALNVSELRPNMGAAFQKPIESFVVLPKSQTYIQATFGGSYNFKGETKHENVFPLPTTVFTNVTAEYASDSYANTIIKPEVWKNVPFASIAATEALAASASRGGTWVKFNTETMAGNGEFQTLKATTGVAKSANTWAISLTQYVDNETPVQIPADESFFVFQSSSKLRSTQPLALAALLKSKTYKDLMTPQDAVILDIYDAELDTPIRRIKLYYQGHITTRGETDEIKLVAKKYYFKFVQISRAGEPIPAPPKYQFNEKLSIWSHTPTKQNTDTEHDQ